MPEKQLYSPLGHTHRCETCERLYTCVHPHTGWSKPSYRCETCSKTEAEDLKPMKGSKFIHRVRRGFR